MKLLGALAGIILAIPISSESNAASVLAVDIDPRTQVADPPGPGQFEGFDYGNTGGVIGWSFNVDSPITVTHLAWYDVNQDGLSHEHRLGLWRFLDFPNFELLGEVTLPAGTSSELVGVWRRIEVAGILLDSGTYFVGGLDNLLSTDTIKLVKGDPLAGDSRISEWAPGFPSEVEFVPPLSSLLVRGVFFGPNFFIEPVPEPSTVALFAIGAMLVGICATRRRSVSRT